MSKRKDGGRSPDEPKKRPRRRSPQEVYDYWTEEMMAGAVPLELERKPPARGGKKENDNGEPGCS